MYPSPAYSDKDPKKIAKGSPESEQVDFSLDKLIKSIKHTMCPIASAKGIALKMLKDTDIPAWMVGDPSHLSQVLHLLIGNGIRLTNSGEVKVEVCIHTQTAESIAIDFSVTTAPTSLTAEPSNLVFEHFIRVKPANPLQLAEGTSELASTTEGLSFRGSQVWVKSTPGECLTFFFTLLFRKSYRSDDENGPTSLPHLSIDMLSGMKVLVVEDNPINQLMAKRLLEKWNMVVDIASTGKEAIEKVQHNTYRIVLMDLQMPEMDGYEATVAIRKITKQLPIIALTAWTAQETPIRALAIGMNDYLSKPYSVDELSLKLCKWAS